MKTTVIYKSNGTVELHGVRRIEEDHRAWYIWYGDHNRRNYLHPEIFPKRGGDLLIIQEEK